MVKYICESRIFECLCLDVVAKTEVGTNSTTENLLHREYHDRVVLGMQSQKEIRMLILRADCVLFRQLKIRPMTYSTCQQSMKCKIKNDPRLRVSRMFGNAWFPEVDGIMLT
jgi:hypothetical protein